MSAYQCSHSDEGEFSSHSDESELSSHSDEGELKLQTAYLCECSGLATHP
jgi:hypothetical protein